jgi:hypothetical protein
MTLRLVQSEPYTIRLGAVLGGYNAQSPLDIHANGSVDGYKWTAVKDADLQTWSVYWGDGRGKELPKEKSNALAQAVRDYLGEGEY